MTTNKFKIIFIAIFLTVSCIANAQTFKFVALGDMPYNIPNDYPRYERLIQYINSLNPAFTIFVGDTKSGSTPCSDDYNLIVQDYFNKFNDPLMYTPGDNEWTDCHRILAGSYDPIERLQVLRKTFFNTEYSLGKNPKAIVRQADVNSQFSKFVENSLWMKNGFLFVNLHITGSNNNNERDDRSRKEYRERNEATLSWINHAFRLAMAKNYEAIVFSYQADMFYSKNQGVDPESGYRDTLKLLSLKSESFKKPVLLIHGDSHRLIIDQPLKTPDQKNTLENVMRLEVMGANELQAVEVQVVPGLEQPFSFTPLIIRQNMLAPSFK